MMGGEEQLSRLICELSSLVLNILHAPHIAIPASSSTARAVAGGRRSQVSPAGFASLLLGASLALMICGSVTFVIGFILMPWVLSIVMFFYFVGFLTNLSGLGRAVLCPSVPKGHVGVHPFPNVRLFRYEMAADF